MSSSAWPPGIYMGRPHASMQSSWRLTKGAEGPQGFTLLTSGANQKIRHSLSSPSGRLAKIVLGNYQCKGFDTFGPWKLIGGIAKGHPDTSDIAGAMLFCAGFSEDAGLIPRLRHAFTRSVRAYPP